MGNNTTTTNSDTVNSYLLDSIFSPDEYTTRGGEKVPTDNHSIFWMKRFNKKISQWIRGKLKSPDEFLNNEEMEYIQNHMDSSLNKELVPNGHLTRVEYDYHIRDKNLKVGDVLPSTSRLRAYSRTSEATGYVLDDRIGGVVIYRTNGFVPHFNATRFDKRYTFEQESWIEQGKLQIDKITTYHDDEVQLGLMKELGFEKLSSGRFGAITNVTIIDTSYRQ